MLCYARLVSTPYPFEEGSTEFFERREILPSRCLRSRLPNLLLGEDRLLHVEEDGLTRTVIHTRLARHDLVQEPSPALQPVMKYIILGQSTLVRTDEIANEETLGRKDLGVACDPAERRCPGVAVFVGIGRKGVGVSSEQGLGASEWIVVVQFELERLAEAGRGVWWVDKTIKLVFIGAFAAEDGRVRSATLRNPFAWLLLALSHHEGDSLLLTPS